MASSRDFNKVVIKAKMHAKTSFFFMKIQYDFFKFFLERLSRMHENKTFYSILFFLLFFFFYENQIFNTEFVSLQYKNTNQY